MRKKIFRLQANEKSFAAERFHRVDKNGDECPGKGGKIDPLSAGSTAEIRLSDQIVQLVTFSRADQFQAIDQKLRSRR